jgi:hypothetical protein
MVTASEVAMTRTVCRPRTAQPAGQGSDRTKERSFGSVNSRRSENGRVEVRQAKLSNLGRVAESARSRSAAIPCAELSAPATVLPD